MPQRSLRAYGPNLRQGYCFSHSWEIPFAEFAAFTHVNEAVCTADHVLAPHRHAHLEICYFHSGRATWVVHGRRYHLRPGDCFLTWPGEMHHGQPDPTDPNHNFAVGFDPSLLPALRSGPAADLCAAVDQTGAAAHARLRVVRGCHGAERLFRTLLSECDAAQRLSAGERLLAVAQVQAVLIELFVLVCRAALRGANAPSAGLPGLEDWLRERLAEPPSVAAMAAHCGLSTSRFTAHCRRAYGETPLELMTRLRINHAQRCLAADPQHDLTTLALALGFTSSQYFATVFRRVTGVSPSAWRAENAQA